MKTQIGYAISLDFGNGRELYTGWSFTKNDMIKTHCEEQGKTWDQCKKDGDRCEKIKIIFPIK